MKISIGSDHRGLQLKARLILLLQELGHEMIDEGTHESESVDYPDYAAKVSEKVSSGTVDRGVLICGSGIGMAIAANKYPAVRATTAYDDLSAEMSRRHNDVNVLCLASDRVGEGPIEGIVNAWLNTDFDGGRHARRLEKIKDIEDRRGGCKGSV